MNSDNKNEILKNGSGANSGANSGGGSGSGGNSGFLGSSGGSGSSGSGGSGSGGSGSGGSGSGGSGSGGSGSGGSGSGGSGSGGSGSGGGGSGGGGSGGGGSGGSFLAQSVKHSAADIKSDLYAIGIWLISAVVILFAVALMIKIIKGKKSNPHHVSDIDEDETDDTYEKEKNRYEDDFDEKTEKIELSGAVDVAYDTIEDVERLRSEGKIDDAEADEMILALKTAIGEAKEILGNDEAGFKSDGQNIDYNINNHDENYDININAYDDEYNDYYYENGLMYERADDYE